MDKWLFTCDGYSFIPNTNNSLEATFNDLKTKLRNYNGLSKEHRKMFINAYLARDYER
ncbi:MAG: hypothetical protein LBR28_01945 [Bacteroidales bacterium]|jgi:hypothetical protein|nr:hypothetical protein [Bacteroidales bacterium]